MPTPERITLWANKSLIKFVQAVVSMRENQKKFFETRANSYLVEAKQAERRVDEMLADMDAGPQDEKLFG